MERIPDNDFTERLNRLVDALLDHRIVPILGAGFSSTARSPDTHDSDPNVRELARKARSAIKAATMHPDPWREQL